METAISPRRITFRVDCGFRHSDLDGIHHVRHRQFTLWKEVAPAFTVSLTYIVKEVIKRVGSATEPKIELTLDERPFPFPGKRLRYEGDVDVDTVEEIVAAQFRAVMEELLTAHAEEMHRAAESLTAPPHRQA